MQELADLFTRFPGIGQRQADRFARHIASERGPYVRQLASAILRTNKANKRCPECFIAHESENSVCDICSGRPAHTLIVVEKDVDVVALEGSAMCANDTNYFVLGNLLPIIADGGKGIRIDDLRRTVERKKPKEVLIALSAHPDADHTCRYVSEAIKTAFPDITVSALGRGLSSGSELEYMDQNTITEAFKGRNCL